MELDEHGQPPEAINWRRNLEKSMESLLGICQGIIADNALTESEVVFLDTWLKENQAVTQVWPGHIIARRVREVLEDGVVTAEEAADLMDTLYQVTAGDLEAGAVSGSSASLPVETVDRMEFDGRVFCFTGKFLYGPRSKCQKATLALGGECVRDVTKALDFLVIGDLASRDWAKSSYGRKIEKAVRYRDAGHGVTIVSESVWARFV